MQTYIYFLKVKVDPQTQNKVTMQADGGVSYLVTIISQHVHVSKSCCIP